MWVSLPEGALVPFSVPQMSEAERVGYAFGTWLRSNATSLLWVPILACALIVTAQDKNFGYAVGYLLPWFILGLGLSPIWWLATKRNRGKRWEWFDWLNAGAIIMAGLLALSE